MSTIQGEILDAGARIHSIEERVEGSDLNILVGSLRKVQEDTNVFLTNIINQAKQGGDTVAEDEEENYEEEDEESDKEPAEKVPKLN